MTAMNEEDNDSHLLLPSINNSQSSFSFSTTDNEFCSLPPEVASADISIARNSFLSSFLSHFTEFPHLI
jgi:hypothetical protein